MNGNYGVIIADPPWNYNNAGCRGAAENEYRTMTLEELRRLPVASVAAEDCVLLMWATWPKLAEAALPLMSAWGFEYVTGFPWVKIIEVNTKLDGSVDFSVPCGIGFWVRGTTEPVLIGRRGKAKPPGDGYIGLLSPNLRHSRKPDSLYEYAESMPGPYLEMFARRPRPGWSAFGNEIEGSIVLEER